MSTTLHSQSETFLSPLQPIGYFLLLVWAGLTGDPYWESRNDVARSDDCASLNLIFFFEFKEKKTHPAAQHISPVVQKLLPFSQAPPTGTFPEKAELYQI